MMLTNTIHCAKSLAPSTRCAVYVNRRKFVPVETIRHAHRSEPWHTPPGGWCRVAA